MIIDMYIYNVVKVIISPASSEEWSSGGVYENSKHYVTVTSHHIIGCWLVGWLVILLAL